MIHASNGLFHLETERSMYLFRIHPTGHLEHLYYGSPFPLTEDSCAALAAEPVNPPGCSIVYQESLPNVSMDHLLLELSTEGVGDLRSPMISLIFSDGSRSADFLYDSFRIIDSPLPLDGLPSAYSDEGGQTLIITLMEASHPIKLELYYTLLSGSDVILRHGILENLGEEAVTVRRFSSLQLDLPDPEWNYRGFVGEWTREMQPITLPITGTELVPHSGGGFSSNRCSAVTMLLSPGADEAHGCCIASNLIYSGSHRESLQMSPQGRIRLLTGMDELSWKLAGGEHLVSPQAVLAFSAEGMDALSQTLHHFVRKNIVRGAWRDRTRPILVNSWEAAYFQFNEQKLLKLAKSAKELGVELFVLDDGWFGHRNNDSCSLGDWTPDLQKLPGGLKQLAEKINAIGLDFGLWVEPEMISEDSDLYRSHPEWVVRIPGRHHSMGRHQMLLDLTQQAVQQYLIDTLSQLFSSASVSYVKWDMNRHFSDQFSPGLMPEEQGGFLHRYILGLYHVLEALTARFPKILFEGCASGGNRFDLGILCYMPQIWTSDNTDAISRGYIQNGCSFAYPPSVMGAHISGCPNHQTLRSTPLETRLATAAFGLLGYEMDLSALSPREKKEIAGQIKWYKEHRKLLQFGSFHRLGGRLNRPCRSTDGLGPWSQGFGDLVQWAVISPERDRAIAMTLQETTQPNLLHRRLKIPGLKEDCLYQLSNRRLQLDIRRFGDLINTVSPVHIRQNGLLHQAASQLVTMDSEQQSAVVSGGLLSKAGIDLAPNFVGTGYSTGTRLYQDFDARLYMIQEIK